MKALLFLGLFSTCYSYGQIGTPQQPEPVQQLVRTVNSLTLDAAHRMAQQITQAASLQKKNIAITVVDASGAVLLQTRHETVGPHNTEAAKRKAFTALSAKTNTLLLARNAAANADTKNLTTVPGLLLLGGGVPVWFRGQLVGSVGVAGGGDPETDDLLARAAAIPGSGFTTNK